MKKALFSWAPGDTNDSHNTGVSYTLLADAQDVLLMLKAPETLLLFQNNWLLAL